ncbi:Six5 [Salinisphaera sp. PC39]|uniref:septal ring lytic transglycosylase RlpA family protein n=1 Tax=Salinisphaera sp. PC39 TaxID=1304156 RepID=UPI0033418243
MTPRLIPAAALAGLLLAGCAADPTLKRLPQRDGPPETAAVDVSEVPDAVPRDEPLSRYGNPDTYEVLGKRYDVMEDATDYRERGYASWYGRKFHGRRTSSGETYDMYKMTAAHRTLPLPSFLRVTNLENGREVIVRVNDRGPFHADRVIDLSYAAAVRLDMIGSGTAPVTLELIEPGTETVAESENPALYLQAGAFSEARNARQLAQRLRGYGLDRVFVSVSDDPEPLYRVRVGPYADSAALAEARRTLEDRGLNVAATRD